MLFYTDEGNYNFSHNNKKNWSFSAILSFSSPIKILNSHEEIDAKSLLVTFTWNGNDFSKRRDSCQVNINLYPDLIFFLYMCTNRGEIQMLHIEQWIARFDLNGLSISSSKMQLSSNNNWWYLSVTFVEITCRNNNLVQFPSVTLIYIDCKTSYCHYFPCHKRR